MGRDNDLTSDVSMDGSILLNLSFDDSSSSYDISNDGDDYPSDSEAQTKKMMIPLAILVPTMHHQLLMIPCSNWIISKTCISSNNQPFSSRMIIGDTSNYIGMIMLSSSYMKDRLRMSI